MPIHQIEVIIGPNLRKWINKPAHRRFASEEWAKGNIQFGDWLGGTRNLFYCIVYDVESQKNAKIEFVHYPNGNAKYPFPHVYADHAHLFG
jgi:hypothetical protein